MFLKAWLLLLAVAGSQACSVLRCGAGWGDANGKCGTSCPSRTDAECPAGENCFNDLSCLPCGAGACPPLALGPNIETPCSTSGGLPEDTTCALSCSAGYSGDATSKTCSGGAWVGSVPECASCNCCPSSPAGGTSTTTCTPPFSSGVSCTVACATAYEGEATVRVCDGSTGTWSGTGPSCINPDGLDQHIIGYWPGWVGATPADTFEWLTSSPPDVDIIVAAFARPSDTGNQVFWPEFNTWISGGHEAAFRAAIASIHGQGRKIVLSIGGWSYNYAWAYITDNAAFAQNIKDWVDLYDFDGVDIDCEVEGNHLAAIPLVKALRAIMPAGEYLLSSAMWSVGAWTAETAPTGGGRVDWSGSAGFGVEIPVLAELKDYYDFVFVMSYDVGPEPGYFPTEGTAAYVPLMNNQKDRVALGIEFGPHGWSPTGTYVTPLAKAVEYAKWTRQHGYFGVMVWEITRDRMALTSEADGAYLAAIRNALAECFEPDVVGHTSACGSGMHAEGTECTMACDTSAGYTGDSSVFTCLNGKWSGSSTCTTGTTATTGTTTGSSDPCADVVCSPSDQCHLVGSCSEGMCSDPSASDGTPCDDGVEATTSDVCTDGSCAGTLDPCFGVTCAPYGECYEAGTCEDGTCSNPKKTEGATCDDDDASTSDDMCTDGVCAGTAVGGCDAVSCVAYSQCHDAGTCVDGACSNPKKTDMVECDDGNVQTTNDVCIDGVCVGTVPDPCEGVTCTALDTCHAAGTCFEGACTHPKKNDGFLCDDGSALTVDDACVDGVCSGRSPTGTCDDVTCAAHSQCHEVGACSGGVCSNPAKAPGTPCDDGNVATVDDVCDGGVCAGRLDASCGTCSSTDACRDAVCMSGACTFPAKTDGSPCDDGDSGTTNDACVSGQCTGSQTQRLTDAGMSLVPTLGIFALACTALLASY